MIVDAEQRGANPEELSDLIGEGRSAMAAFEGDCEDGTLYCGQIGGAIRELKSAKQIVDEVVAEALSVMASFQPYLVSIQKWPFFTISASIWYARISLADLYD